MGADCRVRTCGSQKMMQDRPGEASLAGQPGDITWHVSGIPRCIWEAGERIGLSLCKRGRSAKGVGPNAANLSEIAFYSHTYVPESECLRA